MYDHMKTVALICVCSWLKNPAFTFKQASFRKYSSLCKQATAISQLLWYRPARSENFISSCLNCAQSLVFFIFKVLRSNSWFGWHLPFFCQSFTIGTFLKWCTSTWADSCLYYKSGQTTHGVDKEMRVQEKIDESILITILIIVINPDPNKHASKYARDFYSAAFSLFLCGIIFDAIKSFAWRLLHKRVEVFSTVVLSFYCTRHSSAMYWLRGF